MANDLPEATVEIVNGGLDVQNSGGDDVIAVISTAGGGDVASPLLLSTIDGLVENFVSGPGVEFAAFHVKRAKKPVLFCRVATATAGARAAIDVTGVTGTSVVTSSGTPVDTFDIRWRVVTGGTRGTAGITFQVSKDGAKTWGPVRALGTAITYLIPGTGVTLAFAAGTLVAGDVVRQQTTEPLWDATGLTAAMTALRNGVFDFRCVHVIGVCSPSALGTVDTELSDMESEDLFTYAFTGCRDQANDETEAEYIAATDDEYSEVESDRIACARGFCRITSPIDQSVYRRPFAWAAAMWNMVEDVHVSLAKVAEGKIPGVAIRNEDGVLEERDARITPDPQGRFIEARSFRKRAGVYVALPLIMSAPGSDFSRVHLRAVMDVLCTTVQKTTEDSLSGEVLLNRATGFIREQTAKKLESDVLTALSAALLEKGRASAVSYVFSRTDPLATPGTTLNGEGECLPLGYLEKIKSKLAFTNAAIQALQGG